MLEKNALQTTPFGLQKDNGEAAGALNQNPKQVYVFVHSKEVTINFNKKVNLDHFHYRISPYY